MSLNDLYREMLKRRVVLIEGSVDHEMLQSVRQSLLILESDGSPDIEVRITSNGGVTRISLQICDLLRRYKGKKTGVVYAHARSAGTTILQACDDRVCLPHSMVLIHHVLVDEFSLDDLLSKRRMDNLRRLMLADQKTLYRVLVARTGRSISEVRAACKKDRDMTAEEALAFGLIDRIET